MAESKARLLAWLVGINIFVGLVDGFFKQALYQWSPAAFQVYDFFHYVLLPGACWAWLWRRGALNPSDFGLARSGNTPGEQVLLAGLLGLGLWALYELSNTLFTSVLWPLGLGWRSEFQWGATLDASQWRPLLAVYYAATAGVVEEILFRACLFRLLAGAGGPGAAARYVSLSTLLFALTHWEQGSAAMLAAGVYGCCAAWLYLKLRDLWPLIGAHFLVDLIEFW